MANTPTAKKAAASVQAPQDDTGAEGGPQPLVAGAEQVQHAMDQATDKGYFGSVPDETPNEHYTLPGVLAGKPTPEAPKAD